MRTLALKVKVVRVARHIGRLETVHLHGFARDGETGLLVSQEGADVVALVALKLDDIADLFVVHDGAIASELLLDDLEDLLQVEFARDAGHGSQCLTTITLLDADLESHTLVAGN